MVSALNSSVKFAEITGTLDEKLMLVTGEEDHMSDISRNGDIPMV